MKVAVVMGSDSDFEVMEDAIEVLRDFGIECEVSIISAHRTPELAMEFAKTAESRGIELIIAGAGCAAHLPGVIASLTTLPVIGVPIKAKPLKGIDALLSIVQMPPGIPVATVGINASKNAGLLAVQMLSLKYPELKEKIKNFRNEMKEKVIKKNKKLEEEGFKTFRS
ncbi:MAG: 5-(carboxyamino)imidazole ribonucleotide mutase [Thermodesulfobacteria bacterium]|nr:5-(carboxyamino)imidazole ribonucleotide mutase [Thermodesulfobacteriota bacterium]